MKSKAHVGGHALHPMLVTLPAGAVLFTLVFDLVHLVLGQGQWWLATRPVLAVGLVGAVLAAIPGLVDLSTVVPKGRATAVGLAHLGLNVGLVIALGANTWLRWNTALPSDGTPGLGWSLVSAGLLVASGWLGWTLVQTHHIGVLEMSEGGDPAQPRPEPEGEIVGLYDPDQAHVT